MSTDHPNTSNDLNGNEDDATSTRPRTRVSRACTRCRNRKDKCDGAFPSCATCMSAAVLCSYEPSSKKRGLPEGYVRGLEKLWAVLIRKVEGLDDIVTHILEHDRDTLLRVWNQKDTGDELHSMWKDSKVLGDLEAFLSDLDAASTQGTKRKRDKSEGETTTEDAREDLARVLVSTCTAQHLNENATARNGVRDTHALPQNATPPVPDNILLPLVASKILDQYFRLTHCWLPILDRPYILRRCYEFSRSPATISSENADLAVLAAALAYASNLSDQSETTSILPSGLSWTRLARSCLPSIDGVFQFRHVQALLLLALNDIGRGEWAMAWVSVGLAVRALQGLARQNQEQPKTATATLQACMIIETAIALKLGHTPHLHGDEIIANGLVSEDGHEEWETWHAPDVISLHTNEPGFTISCFNHLTRVCSTINEHVRSQRLPVSTERIKQSLSKLEGFAQMYAPLLADSGARPPHQVWLKVSHFLAVSLVASNQRERTTSVLKNLDLISDTLQTWTSCSTVGLAAMPTFILGLLRSTFDSVFLHSSQPSLSLSLGNSLGLMLLPDRLDRAASTWPESGLLAARLRQEMGRSSQEPSHISPAYSAKRARSQHYPLDPRQTQQGPLNLWHPDPFSQNFTSAPMDADLDVGTMASHMNHSGGQDGLSTQMAMTIADSRSIDLNNEASRSRLGSMSLDNMSNTMRMGQRNPSIATSPSFQGDEVDALFREMAQLDTTEWATGRQQGLKDFGFRDDMTFEAFCNDPDRLYSSVIGQSEQNGMLNQEGLVSEYPGQTLGSILNPLDGMAPSWHG